MARPPVVHDVFTAIADPSRRRILDLLRRGDHSVSALGEHLPLSQPTISEHLKVLRTVGLVSVRKDGRQRIYRIEPGGMDLLRRWIGDLAAAASPAGTNPPATAASRDVSGETRTTAAADPPQQSWSPEVD